MTGAAGFLGSHLSEYLLERGHSVVGMDSLITGDVANIEHLTGRDFVFVKHDVTHYIAIEGPLDYIFHFASPASPIDYLRIPIQTLKVGALGTHNALGLAKAKGARLLLASTSEVYGDPLVHPQREDYWGNVNPIGPRGVYDEAKRFAEAITMAYHRYHGVETRIVRIFNTYGPRMRVEDGRAIPAFASQALRGEDVTVFGDGNQTRSLCYVSDLVDGIYRLMLSDVTDPVNIGNPRGADDPQPRRARGGARRLPLEDRRAAAAGRRPEGPPARHHARAHAARLGAEGAARGGPAADARLLPEEAGARLEDPRVDPCGSDAGERAGQIELHREARGLARRLDRSSRRYSRLGLQTSSAPRQVRSDFAGLGLGVGRRNDLDTDLGSLAKGVCSPCAWRKAAEAHATSGTRTPMSVRTEASGCLCRRETITGPSDRGPPSAARAS